MEKHILQKVDEYCKLQEELFGYLKNFRIESNKEFTRLYKNGEHCVKVMSYPDGDKHFFYNDKEIESENDYLTTLVQLLNGDMRGITFVKDLFKDKDE